MSSRLRRSIVLTTLLALLIGVSGAAAQRADPTSTNVAGIDIDSTTIPELQELMDAHRLKSVQLTQFYLHRIRKLNPTLNAVITISPTALADARAADRARRDDPEGQHHQHLQRDEASVQRDLPDAAQHEDHVQQRRADAH